MDGPAWAPGYCHRSRGVEPIEFRFREEPEDFQVTERLGLEPTGSGEHLWLHIEKRGLSTAAAADRLARSLGREGAGVGYAGRKDVMAVTRQWISVEGADAGRAEGLGWPDLRLLGVACSERGLRTGQLEGNHFRLVLRGLGPGDRARVEEVLGLVEERGLPNYFGVQRFGRLGQNPQLGRQLLSGDDRGYLCSLLEGEGPAASELLRRILAGTWAERRAAGELTADLSTEHAAVARQLVRRPKHLGWLVRAVPKGLRRLHLSALQSVVFNRVLARRMEAGGLDSWWEGDLIPGDGTRGHVHATGDLAQAPLERSATGPVPGGAGQEPLGRPAKMEGEALAAEQVERAAFKDLPAPLRLRGARRPLRVPVQEVDLSWAGDTATLSFALPAGSYATTLLEELAKENRPGRSFR